MYPNAIFSAFALLGALLCIISCPWHLTSWNTGAFLYAIWTCLACLIQFINSVVWTHNYINKAPVYCDIATKLVIGISVGIPTASLCICRRLYVISSLKSFTFSKVETRRSITVDLLIGLGIPTLIMSLHYIVQGHRFDLFEDIGCTPSIYYTWQGYLLIPIPPIIIGLVSAIYAISNIKQFYKIHNRIKLERPEGGITPTMYFRFVCLSTIEVVSTVPLALFCLIFDAAVLDLRFPWISWADTHYDFSKVWVYPASVWRSPEHIQWRDSLESDRWFNIACALVFFAFFGYTDETKNKFKRLFEAVARPLGFRRAVQDTCLPPIHFKPPDSTTFGSFDSVASGGVLNQSIGILSDDSEKKGPDEDSAIAPLSGDHSESFGKHPFGTITPPQTAHVRPRSTTYAIDLPPYPGLDRESHRSDDSIV